MRHCSRMTARLLTARWLDIIESVIHAYDLRARRDFEALDNDRYGAQSSTTAPGRQRRSLLCRKSTEGDIRAAENRSLNCDSSAQCRNDLSGNDP